MVEPSPLHVIRFVDVGVEHKDVWGPGARASRQLEINGQLLSDYLAPRVGRPIEQSTPIVETRIDADGANRYLRALLGGPKEEPLQEGRIALGYCDACLDSSCGVLLAATLTVGPETVTWSNIGFEQQNLGPAPKLSPFWKKAKEPEVIDEHDWWIPEPFSPNVVLTFGRNEYLEAIQSERRRAAARL